MRKLRSLYLWTKRAANLLFGAGHFSFNDTAVASHSSTAVLFAAILFYKVYTYISLMGKDFYY